MSSTNHHIDIESLSLTLHAVNGHLIYQTFSVKKYLISHNSKTGQLKKVHLSYIFLHYVNNYLLEYINIEEQIAKVKNKFTMHKIKWSTII